MIHNIMEATGRFRRMRN